MGDPDYELEADEIRSLVPFQDLDEGRIVDFLCRVGMPLLSGRKKRFSMDCAGKFSSQFHIALTAGLELAEDWPRGFHRLLDEIGSESTAKVRAPLYGSAGAVERWLAKLPEGEGEAIAAATKDYRHHVETTTPRGRPGRRPRVAPDVSEALACGPVGPDGDDG